jgi:hypothetical protein
MKLTVRMKSGQRHMFDLGKHGSTEFAEQMRQQLSASRFIRLSYSNISNTHETVLNTVEIESVTFK